MIAHLLAKELRAQRGAVFGSALVSFVLAGITLLGDARDRHLMTALGALKPVLFAGVPLAAMVLTYTTFTRPTIEAVSDSSRFLEESKRSV